MPKKWLSLFRGEGGSEPKVIKITFFNPSLTWKVNFNALGPNSYIVIGCIRLAETFSYAALGILNKVGFDTHRFKSFKEDLRRFLDNAPWT